ncbi:trichome birefringence-like protein 3 [Tanacetum coccineum]
MLDVFTSNMCADPCGRMGYGRALIEVSSETKLKQELIMAIPEVKGNGHMNVHIQVEYEWKPPICHDCYVFGHSNDQCPKHVIENVEDNAEEKTDGFTTVTNCKKKGKQPQTLQARKIDGLKFHKPKATFVYRLKVTEPACTIEAQSDGNEFLTLKNQFDSLNQDDLLRENVSRESSGANLEHVESVADVENDVEEVYVETNPKGESTPSFNVLDV